ncbi:unnamed protein product [Gadus morhua 'NCC']
MAVATFLYMEVFLVLLLCIPFISPKRWSRLFKSRMVQTIALYGNTSFMVAIAILVFLLIDAFREVRKYSVPEKVDLVNNPTAVEHIHMKLFRAQRNEYIAGFALLLCLLLRRIATLLSQQASLMASNEAFKKQAEGASNAAKKFMEENDQLQQKLKGAGLKVPDAGAKKSGEEEEDLEQEVKTLREELATAKKALQKSDSDVRAMKSQAENLTVEYDRLLGEHSVLLASGDSRDKKAAAPLASDIQSGLNQIQQLNRVFSFSESQFTQEKQPAGFLETGGLGTMLLALTLAPTLAPMLSLGPASQETSAFPP